MYIISSVDIVGTDLPDLCFLRRQAAPSGARSRTRPPKLVADVNYFVPVTY
jgi:hypothetical protein